LKSASKTARFSRHRTSCLSCAVCAEMLNKPESGSESARSVSA
jgi:hypothetical protein